MRLRSWSKIIVSFVICLLLAGIANPVSAAEESLQALMLRKMFASPTDQWQKVLKDNRQLLDTSFFERVEARMRWSIDNGQIDDALRFAYAGDLAGEVVKRKTDYRLQMAQLFRHRGNMVLAADIVSNILITDPHDNEAKFYKASLMHDGGKLLEAYPIYEELYRDGVHKAECAYRMALVDIQKQDILLAKKRLEDAIKIDPQHDMARIELAKLDKFISSASFAPPTTSKAATIPVDTNDTWNDKRITTLMDDASFALASNEPNKAIDLYNQVIALDPTMAKAYVNVGAIYFQQGEFEMAMRNFILANKYSPNSFEITRYMGFCCEGMYDQNGDKRDLARASDYYAQSNSLNPNNDLIKFDLNRIEAKKNAVAK